MKRSRSPWLRYGYLGPHLFLCTVLGGYGGHWVDRWVGSDPVFMLIGGGLGVAAGMITLFREVAAMNREEQQDRDGDT